MRGTARGAGYVPTVATRQPHRRPDGVGAQSYADPAGTRCTVLSCSQASAERYSSHAEKTT